ncbi:MGMT family protein [Paenibacillus solisilvae]|uniref:MGMT family protein n=1 Tax=Paenibacillus solisilvae TaxID=2486751 RepID=A0ABW0VWU0_9BACL
MKPFTQEVVNVIKGIPAGYVMTYGQIAQQAGSPRGARQVVRILHSLSAKHDLPWHRVVNAKGEIVIKDDEGRFSQTYYLQEEGVLLSEAGLVDLEKYKYHPD